LKKGSNFLTKNEKYIYLLLTIGKSQKHLSASEIKKSMSRTGTVETEQQVYELIENLNSFFLEEYAIRLLNWKTITKDVKQQKKVLDILKKYFHLDWIEDYIEGNSSGNKQNCVIFEKIFEKEIIIKNTKEKDKIVKIVKDGFGAIGKLSIILGREKQNVNVYSKGMFVYLSSYDLKTNKQISSLENFYSDPARFLETKLDDKSQEELESIIERIVNLSEQIKKKQDKSINNKIERDECDDLNRQHKSIISNRKLLRYHLNIRGFLLYIVGEIESEKKTIEVTIEG
jgi:hypothetical protein